MTNTANQVVSLAARRATIACRHLVGVKFCESSDLLCGTRVEAVGLDAATVVAVSRALSAAGMTCIADVAFRAVTLA